MSAVLDRLAAGDRLTAAEYIDLVEAFSPDMTEKARMLADAVRRRHYGNQVFIRGLIEVGNLCRNDCLYCGIRRSNTHCQRYQLSREEILSCCREGYALGFRTFVLQGGEGSEKAVEPVCGLIREIKRNWPDCAVTLSLGEYPRELYQAMSDAGADRYLLRHETATAEHYRKLHPPALTLENRLRCLYDLQDIGFQTGCGFMVGSPFQRPEHLGADLYFIQEFSPAMCGIGPFIPHHDTPFAKYPAGSADLTVYLLSILRLMHPRLLLPATTALGTVRSDGHQRGILAGANVVMPNLSPLSVRSKYALYDNKAHTGSEAAEGLAILRENMASIGYEVVTARGDPAEV